MLGSLSITTHVQLAIIPYQESTSPSIRDWEEAGASLTVALNKYLNLCCSLWKSSLREGVPPRTLAARIDSTLGIFHNTLDMQLARARSTLSQTRNRITSPIYHFPEEVLLEIFTYVIYTPLNPSKPVPMRDSLVKRYRSLHSLLGVCTVWRNVTLGHKPFWSTVPIIDSSPSPLSLKLSQATKLSLERSGSVDLDLAAILTDRWRRVPNLDDHISRFRTVNVTAKSPYVVQSVIDPFLKLGSSRRLSDLSVRLQKQGSFSKRIPRDYDYVYSLYSSDYDNSNCLLKDLSVLRLCSAPVDFNHIVFSGKLVELHIQEVTLGRDAAIVNLLEALSSAGQLRDLRFISIITFPDSVTTSTTTPKVSLPNLQRLLVQDLHNNTMWLLLESITSRSHHLTLHLTQKCLEVQQAGRSSPENIDADDLYEILCQISVNTLLVGGDEVDDHWLGGAELETMMRLMPDLKTLQMKYCDLGADWCDSLTRKSHPNRPELSLPALENIHFSSARIWNVEAFKSMVASYSDSLKHMILDAAVPADPPGGEGLESLVGDEDIVIWLKANVPEFELTYGDDPPEFESPEWQLW